MSDFLQVKVKKLSAQASLPAYATPASAAVDLCACISEPKTIEPGEKVKVPTGIAIELPNRYCVALVFARSGLASRMGVSLTNGVGVIDADYRGEIQVLMQNLGTEPVKINSGDRIAQMIVMPIFEALFEEVAELSDSERGTSGFGSTGI